MTSNGIHLAMASSSQPAPDISVVQTTASNEIVIIKGRRYRQRQLGPAPFASFEDLSDELDSPPETARVTLPGIKEDPSSQLQSPSSSLPEVAAINLTEKEEQNLKDALKNSLVASGPPRIDISRASSSSQHEDSLTSSPDRENDAHNLGYKEDGTAELRSSTEELYFVQETGTVEESEEKRKREKVLKRQQEVKSSGDMHIQQQVTERKDSSCSVMSDVGLLCISGRTSRLSSIGSVASGGSAVSGTSHLSAGSHLSGRSSQSPSPHKMLLETSFCGSKPMCSLNVESDAASATITPEKSANKLASAIRSRSPSPHKMLLETSFCGTKISSPETEKFHDNQKKTPRKRKSYKIAAEIETPGFLDKQNIPKVVSEKSPEKKKLIEKPKVDKLNEVKSFEKAVEMLTVSNKPQSSKSLLKVEKTSSKPKKIISLRDLPVDEIYIPLKGPEVDFEEIIRKASPNVKKKMNKSSTPSTCGISVPSVSPTKTIINKESSGVFAAKSCTVKSKTENVSQKTRTEASQMKNYKICEDGSIFIPLHSPDEDERSKEFENVSDQLEKELENIREEKQIKPEILNLTDSPSNATKLQSSTWSASKSEMAFGDSRTPSPGSSLSRKSSFANLFRKSDVSGSPDSQSGGGGSGKKKSGTSIASRETVEGSEERSNFCSKSKERYTGLSASSGKKSVFTNLFGKKKAEAKVAVGKDTEPLQKFDLQFTFNTGDETSRKIIDEGDYIIIPLRDPSDRSQCLDMEHEIEALNLEEKKEKSLKETEKPSESNVKKEINKIEYTKPQESLETLLNKESVIIGDNNSDKEKTESVSEKSTSKQSENINLEPTFHKQNSESSLSSKKENELQNQCHQATEKIGAVSILSESHVENVEVCFDERSNEKISGDKSSIYSTLDKESFSDVKEEKTAREEVMTVITDGVRQLKLPPEPGDLDDDHERKGLVYQESFEDELPYIPTTLPLERSLGVPIIPVKQRIAEIKTCPIERPRSTTPINPTTLEDFVASKEPASVNEEEKMRISLPREDSVSSKSKSPRRYSAKGKSWFEFAEEGLQSPRDHRKCSLKTSPSPPPLPPKSPPATNIPPTTSSRINFETLPEKKKLPKRIVTVPALRNPEDSKGSPQKTSSAGLGNVVYHYVSPEECQCECHDYNASNHDKSDSQKGTRNVLSSSLREVNIDCLKKLPTKISVTNVIQEESEKSGCEYCEGGKDRSESEENVEGRPLLGENSDDDTENDGEFGSEEPNSEWNLSKEEESITKRAGDVIIRKEEGWKDYIVDVKVKPEKLSPSNSDSSSERYSSSHSATGLVDNEQEITTSKPFEMDLQVDSNDSSLLSQEDLISSSGSNNSICH